MSLFSVREAKPEDVSGMAKVRVDTWRSAYKGILPEDTLENLSYQQVADAWQKAFWENSAPGVAVFVADNDQKEIVGIAICGPERTQDASYQGEIYILYVLPEYQNQGLGKGLVAACVKHLREQVNVETMLIWVIAENPYRRFYESIGGKVIREKQQEIGGRMILEAGYGWEKIQDLEIL